MDVGNSQSLQGTGNSGVIIALPWVVRNPGALQVAVLGSQSHGVQLPQEKHRAPTEPWGEVGQDQFEPSATTCNALPLALQSQGYITIQWGWLRGNGLLGRAIVWGV